MKEKTRVNTRLLSVPQLAEALGVSPAWVWRRIGTEVRANGTAIPHYRDGKTVRFDLDKVLAHMECEYGERPTAS